MCAISGTKGSSGFGSHNSEQIDNKTFEIVNAGDHCSFKMSKQMLPWEFTFGWYTFVLKFTLGGLNG
jgi:hypothetical protein